MQAEFELVHYPKMRHVRCFLNELEHRAYHEHNDAELLAVLRGRASIRVGTGEFTLEEGQFAAFNPRAAHQITAEEGCVLTLILQYSPYLCREYYPHARRMMFSEPNASACLEPAQNKRIFAAICAAALTYFGDDRLFELRCLSRLTGLMVLLAENLPCEYLNPEQHHSRINKAHKLDAITAYLEDRFQQPLRLEEVAEVAGMTPAYLSHFFRENMGVSFQEYLNALRFENALRVIDRPLPLRDIAHGSGFSDPKYLTKMFLKKTGLTPAAYRQERAARLQSERNETRRGERETILSEADSIEILRARLDARKQEETEPVPG